MRNLPDLQPVESSDLLGQMWDRYSLRVASRTLDVDEKYQTDPLLWIDERLGISPHTIKWSLNPGYQDHCVPHGDVLTPSGWRDIRSMAVGDPIYTVDRRGEMVTSKVLQVHRQHYTGELVEVQGRRLRLIATPNHRIAQCGASKKRVRYESVRNPRDGRGIKETAQAVAVSRDSTYESARTWTRRLRQRGYRDSEIVDLAITDREHPVFTTVPVSDMPVYCNVFRGLTWVGSPIGRVTPPSVPRKLALQRTKTPQPTSLSPTQYAALLGWYLSEGCGVGRDRAFCIAQKKKPQRQRLRRLLNNCGFRCSWSDKSVTVYAPDWWNHFRVFGKAADKYIPEEIKHAQIEVLRALFDAMMDGDGHWRNQGVSGTYCSISHQLADDFAEVALRLGYTVYQSEHAAQPGIRRKQYHISITTKETYWPGQDRIQRVQYDGPIYCLGIPDTHTFIIRQFGSVWVSGNSWDGDVDALYQVLEGLATPGTWVALESATAVGKTIMAAMVMFWWLECFKNSEVVTIAPTKKQLKRHMWKEVGKLWPRFAIAHPFAELLELEIRMDPVKKDWLGYGFGVGVGAAEKSATRAQGAHNVNLLFITEETPGVHNAVMTAIGNTLVGGPRNQWLALGNPDHLLDELHLLCDDPRVTSLRVSAHDHPNVVLDDYTIVPGAVTKQSITDRLAKANGNEDDLFYKSRTRGICPEESEFTMIKLHWLKEAVTRGEELRLELIGNGEAAWGIDVAASEGGDKGAIARGIGNLFQGVETFPCPDAGVLGARVAIEAATQGVARTKIGVDIVGVGEGTWSEMKRRGYRPIPLRGGAKPALWVESDQQFANLRSQMYWAAGEDLRMGYVGIEEDDEELFRDLMAVVWTPKGGKIAVEDKKELRKRIGRSPDKGDAYVYWNWIRRGEGVEILIGRA